MKKVIALSSVLAMGALGMACGEAPANNTAKPASPSAMKPATPTAPAASTPAAASPAAASPAAASPAKAPEASKK